MSAYTPNLPALIPAQPGDQPRAAHHPQSPASAPAGCCPHCAAPLPGAQAAPPPSADGVKFTRDLQVIFLENLSITGSVRSAASAARVSHQTAYRARRGAAGFRIAWDAALVVARAQAEATLACRAIDGVEEQVFYHGEVVATRTRYSDRLLLAHLARLDRMAETPAAGPFAEDWDAALARFGAGEDIAAPSPDGPQQPEQERAGGADNFSPGPCNMRSTPSAPGPESDGDDDGIDWDDEDAAYAEIDRVEAAMAAARPADAPELTGVGPDGVDRDPDGMIADAQWQAFARGAPRWWLVVPPLPSRGSADWRYAGEVPDAAADAAGARALSSRRG